MALVVVVAIDYFVVQESSGNNLLCSFNHINEDNFCP